SRELGRQVQEVAPEALERLEQYGWPGNIRELQSVLKQALLQATGPILLPEFLPPLPAVEPALEPSPGGWDLEACLESRSSAGTDNLYAEALEQLERRLLPWVLRHTGGNQVKAARLLGITRGYLRGKLRDLGIRIDRTVQADEEPPEPRA